MPAKRKTPSTNRKAPIKPQVTSSMGSTYDTQMIITILLLLFVYPIGLLFMWVWMKWPVWLKLVISIPFILAIVLIALMLFAAGSFIRNGRFEQMMRDQQYRQMMQQRQEQIWQISPTPTTYNTY